MSETIKYQKDEGGIVTLTIDIADRSMNVLTPRFMQDLDAAVDRIVGDDSVRGAIITSAKASFIAGADLKELVGVFGREMDEHQIYEFAGRYSQLYRKLETCGKPFVAAINGTALGGGLELCLACHHRVVLDNPKAAIGLPEVKVGLLPGAGGTQRLPRLIGIRESLPLMLEGRHLKPPKAVELGICNELATDVDDMMERARRWLTDVGDPVAPWDKKGFKVPGGSGGMHPAVVQTFMAGNAMVAEKTQHRYPAPISIMSCVYEGTQIPIDKGLKVELQYFTKLLAGPVARNMIRTLFIDKGAADKLARRPADVPKSHVKKLGVLGAGMMGAGIAYVSAYAGQEVVLLDRALEDAEKGKGYSRALLEKRVSRGRMTEDQAAAVLGRIKPGRLRSRDRGRVRGSRHQGRRDGENRSGDSGDVDFRQQHLDAADHGSRPGVTQAGAVYRHPLLLAGGQDATGGNHPRRKDGSGGYRPCAGLCAADPEDPDPGQRQSRLLHQPRVFHLRQGRDGVARRGCQTRADRECRQDGRHARRSPGGP